MADHLIICSDLFFTSKVGGTAEMLGFDCVTVMSGAKAIEILNEMEQVKGIVIDLMTPGLSLSELLTAIPESSKSSTIAFGPHVERNLLQQAEAGGCAAVFTRSQFSAELPDILKQYFSSNVSPA